MTKERLSAAASAAGILGGLSAFSSFLVNLRRSGGPKPNRSTLVTPHLIDDAKLVDRTTEVSELFDGVNRSRVVNCFGDRGAGKSFFLSYVTDIINGFRPRNPGHQKLRGYSAALYYDLADVVGFDEIQSHVCREALGEDGTWKEFIAYVNSAFKHRKVILILDNVNSPELWPAVGRAGYDYLARRPKDKLILGSIDPVGVINLDINHVPIGGLDLAATEELVANTGAALGGCQLAELHRQFEGLPFYIELLAPFGGAQGDESPEGMEAVVEAELMPRLDLQMRTLLAYASLFAVANRRITIGELESCPLPNLDELLERAKGLLTPAPEDQRLIGIHDVLRDVVLRAAVPEVTEAAYFLFRRAQARGQDIPAALLAMFADPGEIGEENFDKAIRPVIEDAVRARNYALVAEIYKRANQNQAVVRHIAEDEDRHDLLCYARASQLAGRGEYAKAEDKLLQGSVGARRDNKRSLTGQEAEMRFLLADIAHLQNRYDDAALMFKDLGDWASSSEYLGLHARCEWGRAHVLRHQGRELEKAQVLFESDVELAALGNELFAKAYSVTGATGIKVFAGAVPADEEARLAAIEDEIVATHAHDSYLLEVWKSQAQVAWLRGQRDTAFSIVHDATKKALALNDRLLYNLYFEQAEFLRLIGRPESALSYYGRVLAFGEGNGDRNLIANARLGLVLADISTGPWAHHGSSDHARGSALEARKLSLAADIQATARAAELVVGLLDDGESSAADSLRLILF
jgi:tetratricopeptide (TPR) repeat protein